MWVLPQTLLLQLLQLEPCPPRTPCRQLLLVVPLLRLSRHLIFPGWQLPAVATATVAVTAAAAADQQQHDVTTELAPAAAAATATPAFDYADWAWEGPTAAGSSCSSICRPNKPVNGGVSGRALCYRLFRSVKYPGEQPGSEW